jgi:hypothetical protein
MCKPKMWVTNQKFLHKKCMTRFRHKFDLIPKLCLRRQLEGLNINKKYKVLTSASWQKELYYLNVFN